MKIMNNKQNQAWLKSFTMGCFVALMLQDPFPMPAHASIVPDLRMPSILKNGEEARQVKEVLGPVLSVEPEQKDAAQNKATTDFKLKDMTSKQDVGDIIKQMAQPALNMPDIAAKHVYAFDASSNRVLYEKNAKMKVSIASTTKIMTALVALEAGDLQKKFVVSDAAQRVGGSTMGLRKGGEWTLEELLYGLLLRSGNDAAVVIAEGIGGSVENFAQQMNKKAIELGLKDSHFVTPHGLDAENQYSTAEDLAILTKVALENPIFSKIVETKKVTLRNRDYYNTNPLLNAYQGVDGVKTGYTDSAGRCLVVSAKKRGLNLIGVILNSPSSNSRVADARNILDTIFDRVQLYHFQKKGDEITKVQVNNGKQEALLIKSDEDLNLALTEVEQKGLKVRTNLQETYDAPIQAGEVVGTRIYEIPNQPIFEISLVAAETVLKKTYLDYFVEIVKVFLEEFSIVKEKVA